MTAAERRRRRFRKIKQRERIIAASGLQQGSLYDRHKEKIETNTGYLAKHGTILHYAKGTKPVSQKTRNKKSYSGTENWSHKDRQRLDDMQDNLDEYNTEYM